MNYEMLIERARNSANNTVCLVEPRHLHQMADALENQAKVIKGLEEIIWKQDRDIACMCDGCSDRMDNVTKRTDELKEKKHGKA